VRINRRASAHALLICPRQRIRLAPRTYSVLARARARALTPRDATIAACRSTHYVLSQALGSPRPDRKHSGEWGPHHVGHTGPSRSVRGEAGRSYPSPTNTGQSPTHPHGSKHVAACATKQTEPRWADRRRRFGEAACSRTIIVMAAGLAAEITFSRRLPRPIPKARSAAFQGSWKGPSARLSGGGKNERIALRERRPYNVSPDGSHRAVHWSARATAIARHPHERLHRWPEPPGTWEEDHAKRETAT